MSDPHQPPLLSVVTLSSLLLNLGSCLDGTELPDPIPLIMAIFIARLYLTANPSIRRVSMAPTTLVKLTRQLINYPNQEMTGDDLAYPVEEH